MLGSRRCSFCSHLFSTVSDVKRTALPPITRFFRIDDYVCGDATVINCTAGRASDCFSSGASHTLLNVSSIACRMLLDVNQEVVEVMSVAQRSGRQARAITQQR